jgi:large subunit ribosomal protein L54
MLPSTSNASRPIKSKQPKQQKLMGSIPGGTPLHGLGYLKAKPTVLAKEDDEYPDWLWTLLAPEAGAKSKDGMTAADVAGKHPCHFSQSSCLLLYSNVTFLALPRAARDKYTKKQAKLLKTLPKTIPIHEQSKDLTKPGDSAEISMQRRQELVYSSRTARRKDIKEENFLRGM